MNSQNCNEKFIFCGGFEESMSFSMALRFKVDWFFFKGDAPICIGGLEVEERGTHKDLGIMVNSSWTWTPQAEFRCGKAIKALHLIRRNICDLADSDTRLNLCKGYIVPILSYGSILWKTSKNNLNIIEILQKKTSKWILR